MKKLLLGVVLAAIAAPSFAQNAASGSPRVQGTPDGYGDPVQVTIVSSNGSDQTGANSTTVQGPAAVGASIVGAPILNGGKIYSGASGPIAAQGTSGQAAAALVDERGYTLVRTVAIGSAPTDYAYNVGVDYDGSNTFSAPVLRGVTGFASNGTTSYYSRGDAGGLSISRGVSGTRWSYTSGTSPILSNTTTAVTVKTAAGAGIKNVIDSCQLTTTAFGASVPLVFRDGAAGTVRWALTVPTAGFLQPVPLVFEQPFVTTANTLIEVATPTANTSGTVTLSCQGHTEGP